MVVCILVIVFSGKISAQPFSYYINYTSTWSMYSGAADGINYYISHFQYKISGDTTIAGKHYFRLFRVGVDSVIHVMFPGPADVTFDSSYAGALREDPSKKLYFIYQSQSAENLLYDFALLPGMNLQNMQANYGCNTPAAIVQGYDTVYLGTLGLKRFKFDNPFIAWIIEGVGSGGGLIEQGGMCMGIEANATLICYKKDNAVLEVNTNFTPCTLKADSIVVPPVIINDPCDDFSIYPNPAKSTVYIHAGCSDMLRTITVINPLGQRISVRTGLQQNHFEVNVENLPKGVYFFCIETNRVVITKKIVKG